MKKYALFALALLAYKSAHAAAFPVNESPINGYGDPVTIAISSTTLTKVPTTQTSGRFGLFINNPTSNTAPISGFMGNCTSASFASTIRPIVFSTAPRATVDYLPMREDVCLWLISENLAASTANLHYQEIKK